MGQFVSFLSSCCSFASSNATVIEQLVADVEALKAAMEKVQQTSSATTTSASATAQVIQQNIVTQNSAPVPAAAASPV